MTDRVNAVDALGSPLEEGLRGEADRGGAAASDPEMAEGVRRYLAGRERPGG